MVYRNREYKPADDIRETSTEFFEGLNATRHFTIDACALPSNAKRRLFYAPDGLYLDGVRVRADVNGLTGRYDQQRVYCNPPFSAFPEWLPWAWEHSEAESITMIAPATRTDRPWWHQWVEPYRDNRPEVLNGPLDYLANPLGDNGWRLSTSYTDKRIDFLEDGHPCWRRDRKGVVQVRKAGTRKGEPFESTAMFGLVILDWRHV